MPTLAHWFAARATDHFCESREIAASRSIPAVCVRDAVLLPPVAYVPAGCSSTHVKPTTSPDSHRASSARASSMADCDTRSGTIFISGHRLPRVIDERSASGVRPEFIFDAQPANIRAQLLACDGSFRGLLDPWALRRWNLTNALCPLGHGGRLYPQYLGQFAGAPRDFNCFGNCLCLHGEPHNKLMPNSCQGIA